MKAASVLDAPALPVPLGRVADYLELARPRVAVLVLVTVAVGALLAAPGAPALATLVHVLLGTALVASGASAFNQLIERHSDALMSRTENRPLPAGRLPAGEVLALGIALAVCGLGYLLATVEPLAAGVAAFTLLSYVFVYTPLKRVTPLNTLVGAVPGAMPPVIGWTAVRGTLDWEAGALFLIVFLWQIPHFLAIAWLYREQYAGAGLLMLPVVDDDGRRTARQMVRYTLVLIPVSLLPALLGQAGLLYMTTAVVLGSLFFTSGVAFARDRSMAEARRVLRTSLVYLPLLLLLLVLDRQWQWWW
jgi:protoheme IX farnesyltransferase